MSRPKNTPLSANPTSEVCLRQQDGSFSKTSIGVEEQYFYGAPSPRPKGRRKKGEAPPPPPSMARLVIGFDTEYVGMKNATLDQIKHGEGRYRVLSYQVWCRLVDEDSPEHGREWGDVFYPSEVDARFGLDTLINFAVWKGVSSGVVSRVPRQMELVCHYGKADMPALADFREMSRLFEAVRNCFITLEDLGLAYALPGGTVDLKVRVRDTHLLTAEGSKALADVGRVTNTPKVKLSDDPAREQFLKENMDVLLREDPKLFHDYALTDAVICVRYFEQVREICREVIGTADVPLTISGIGVERLLGFWESDPSIDANYVRGLETVIERRWDSRRERFVTTKPTKPVAALHMHETLATEAYHGGRNEQFWFGPAPEGVWNDYDLSSAYPTAMSIIGFPEWSKARVTTDLKDFASTTLGVAWVKFRFPDTVRYPVIPVRTENGLIFPLSGEACCSAPEISLAKALGATLTILHGVVVPDRSNAAPPFRDFVRDGVTRRGEHLKGSLKNQFWKEMNNSTYGKLAQGLQDKRVYSLRDKATQQLGPSKVTNPFYAAFTTGYVRAVLGEIMNALPASVKIFSCTTDGFLTTATLDEMNLATAGEFCRSYRVARIELTGSDDLLELKHQCRRPLGWRTRGQATIVPGDDPTQEEAYNFVLAKSGLRAPDHCKTVRERNDYITSLFLHRKAGDSHEMKSFTGVRDIVELGNDLVDKTVTRKLNMEYDFKRRPVAMGSYIVGNVWHIAWVTSPWDKVEDFLSVRSVLETYLADGGECLKSRDDFCAFATILLAKTGQGRDGYVNKTSPDIKLLKRYLCAARQQGRAGLSKEIGSFSAQQFADLLTDSGVPCRRSDVENGGRKPFQPRHCPDTPSVRSALAKLKRVFPTIDESELLASRVGAIDFLSSMTGDGGGYRLPLELRKIVQAA